MFTHLQHARPHDLGPLLPDEADPGVERGEEAGHVASDDGEDGGGPHLFEPGRVLLLRVRADRRKDGRMDGWMDDTKTGMESI